MSWTDEEIDKMFQEGADGLHFEYKDSHWKEMEAMLPKEGSKGDFLWFFTAFVFLGLFGVLTTINMSGINSSTNKSVIAEVVTSKSKDAIGQSENNSIDHQTTNTITMALGDEIARPQVRTASVITVEANSPSSNSLDKNDLMTKNISSKTKAQKESNKVEINNPDNIHLNRETRETEVTSDEQVSAYVVDESSITENVFGPVDRLNFLEAKVLESESRNLMTYSNYPPKVSTHASIYVQGLGGLSQSFVSPSSALAYSYGFGAGVQFQNKDWKFNLGINAIISNHNDLNLNRTAKVYGFGSEVYNYHLNYQQLYIVEGDFKVARSFGKHDMSLGVRPSYTFSSKVKMREDYINNSMSDINESNSRNVYGFMDGLKSLGVKPQIGYAYSFTPGLQLGVNIGVQLMPMINEDFLEGYTNRLPFDGQIYLRKTIDFK